MVGDGSYLMMSSEIATCLQEGYKINIVLIDNYGFASINGLSERVGCQGFGTRYRFRRSATQQLDGPVIPIDFAANAASYGAHAISVADMKEFETALAEAKKQDRTTVIVIRTQSEARVPDYDTWWDVPVAAVSEVESVRAARKQYEEGLTKQRSML